VNWLESDRRSSIFVALLCGIVALPLLGVSLTLPSLPSLRGAFAAPVERVQWTISAYYLCLAAMQLPYGALSDRYGRRPLLIAALALYGFAAAACAFASSLEVLIGFRVLQGLGAAGCMVLARAVVGDAFTGARGLRMMTIVLSGPGVVALMAPAAGGWLSAAIGWRGVFATLAGVGLLLAAAAVAFLPETKPARVEREGGARETLRACAAFFGTPAAFGSASIMAFCQAGLYATSYLSAFIFIEVFGVAEQHYGWLLAITGGTMLCGSWAATLLPPLRRQRAFSMVAPFAVVTAIGLFAATMSPMPGVKGIVAIMVPLAAYAFCCAFFSPTAGLASVRAVPQAAGIASAITGTMQIGLGAVFIWLGGRLYDGTPSALGICIAIAAVIWTSLYLSLGRRWLA